MRTPILKFFPCGAENVGGREPPAPGDFFELLAGGENEGGHFLFLEGHPGHIPELSPPLLLSLSLLSTKFLALPFYSLIKHLIKFIKILRQAPPGK